METGTTIEELFSPLAQVDVDALHGQRVDRVRVGGDDRDAVPGKAHGEEGERGRVDNAHAVGLAGLHRHVVPAAACTQARTLWHALVEGFQTLRLK